MDGLNGTPSGPPPTAPAAVAAPRLSRRRFPAIAGLVVASLGLVAVMLASVERLDLLLDPERRALELTRVRHATLARLGHALPGTPDLGRLDARLAEHGVALGAPVLIRTFKREHELEIWLGRDGRYHRFATYPICRWSGELGPKIATGDRQAPEGFYTVSAAQLNPNSRWYRSFNLGFPNPFDRMHGRTGSALMVHGGCSSAGCYAMTNPVMDEVWRLVSAALARGQKRFQVQAFPFRITEQALAAKADDANIAFWRNLKVGHDLFEDTLLAPDVSVCRGAYRFEAATGPPSSVAAIERRCEVSPVAGVGKKTKKSL